MADIFEEALKSIGAAISDVREKVVEEAWFGRAVTDGSQEQAAPAPVEINVFDSAIAGMVQEASPASTEMAHDAPEPGGGMER